MLAFDHGDPAAALDLLEPFDGGDQGHGAAADIRNDRLDILAANLLGRAPCSPARSAPTRGLGPGRCAELHRSTRVTSGATRDGMTIESYPRTVAARQ